MSGASGPEAVQQGDVNVDVPEACPSGEGKEVKTGESGKLGSSKESLFFELVEDIYESVGDDSPQCNLVKEQPEGGDGVVTLVVERAVDETEQLAPREAGQLQPLREVIFRDLSLPMQGDRVEDELNQLSPAARARMLFDRVENPTSTDDS